MKAMDTLKRMVLLLLIVHICKKVIKLETRKLDLHFQKKFEKKLENRL